MTTAKGNFHCSYSTPGPFNLDATRHPLVALMNPTGFQGPLVRLGTDLGDSFMTSDCYPQSLTGRR